MENQIKATIIYCTNWWDGPMSGVAKLEDGQEVYFEYYKEYEDSGRQFNLYKMTPEGIAYEAERHASWNACCGNKSYDLPTDHKPSGKLNEHYAKYPPGKRDIQPYNENGFIGRIHEENMKYNKVEQYIQMEK